MDSVADGLRQEQQGRVRALSAAERVALALALGARDLALYRRGQCPPMTVEEARRRLRSLRQVGRRPSRCHDALMA
jgi:hypothetical protein